MSGLRFLAFLAICIFPSLSFAQSAMDKYKTQLEAAATSAKPVPLVEKNIAAQPPATAADTKIEAIDEADVHDLEPIEPETQDAAETEPLRLSLDKPEIIRLDRDAINVIVGSNENLRVVPDTNKTLLLIAKKPGSTYFRALDADGKIIMQRHVIIGSPTKNYIRIRRACANGNEGCKQYSVYYCPDMCHEVDVVQDAAGPGSAIPEETPQGRVNSGQANQAANNDNQETPLTSEPPPGE